MKYFEDFQVGMSMHSTDSYEISKEEIVSFCRQWDPQPFHIDEEFAQQSPLGKLFTSSVHTVAIGVKLTNTLQTEQMAVVAGLGWDDVRFYEPVCVGDRLTARTELVAMRESSSKPDRGILTSLVEVINQHDRVAASYKISMLIMKRVE